MSLDLEDADQIELIIYSQERVQAHVELLTVCAFYHRNVLQLNLHHTVNFGRPWVTNSLLDHGFISLPYLDGPQLETFELDDRQTHCYWLIPITQQERDYKIAYGCEYLEQLFEEKQLNYLDTQRDNLVVESHLKP